MGMRAHLKKQILLGIRPENVRISKLASGQPHELRARTERIEMLGGETHLYFDLGTGSCVARTTSSNGLSLDENVSLDFEMARAHFFDGATGERIHL
jgi:multiple sugar transport system ATP-binding protein